MANKFTKYDTELYCLLYRCPHQLDDLITTAAAVFPKSRHGTAKPRRRFGGSWCPVFLYRPVQDVFAAYDADHVGGGTADLDYATARCAIVTIILSASSPCAPILP